MKIKVSNIYWDSKEELPKEVFMEFQHDSFYDVDETIAEELSNFTRYCALSFVWEVED